MNRKSSTFPKDNKPIMGSVVEKSDNDLIVIRF